MPIANLDRCWSYAEGPFSAKPYGPGEDVDIPQGLYDLLSKAGRLEGSASSEDSSDELEDKLGHNTAQLLKDAGYEDADSVREATDEELLAIDGIGKAKLEHIRKDVG
jgi:hypothetical protein